MIKIVRFLKEWAMVLILLILIAVFYFSGLRLVAVVSGSMEPTIPVWSLCVANTRVSYEEIETGDVVVYVRRSDAKRIIHRVVEITENGIITKGDANAVSDGVSVGPDNLFAKYLWHIPWMGYLSLHCRTPVGITVKVLLFGLCAAGILFLGGGKNKQKKKDGET